ncbi:amino acid ABC transporter substrate-binding protein [Desulforamulus ruminis]|uniref:amino acid ABC transporter substrate-binding protein n=1 Tax=Desulforamulus ruminis TaxID=1564 RepID=UPI002FDB855D
MRRYVILSFMVMMALSLFTGCGNNNDSSGNSAPEKATFTVGFDKEFPPMGFVAEDGSYTGFDLDLAKEVATRLGLELKLQPIDWNAKNMELDSGNIDCVWNGFTINGREKEYEWTKPYMNNNQIVVVLADSNVTKLSDLAGKIVGVQDDSSALTAIDGNAEFKNSLKSLVKTPTNLNALMELESGAVDAVVMDEIVARYTIEKKGANYKVLDESIGAEEFGVGFKLGNKELRDKVEAALIEMAKDGKLAEISDSWFGKDITTIGK